MKILFTKEFATSDSELYVDSVLQKPFIEINEAGTTTKTEPGNL